MNLKRYNGALSVIVNPTPMLSLYRQRLFTPSEPPLLQYIKCMSIFDEYIQTYSVQDELAFIIKCMKDALAICMQTSDLELATDVFTNAVLFSNQYTYKALCDTPPPWTTIIFFVSALTELACEYGWALFHRIQKEQPFLKDVASSRYLSDIIRGNLIDLALSDARAHLECITDNKLESETEYLETKLNQLRDNLIETCITVEDNDAIYSVDQLLFSCFVSRTKLAINRKETSKACEFLGKCNWLKIKYSHVQQMKDDYTALKNLFIELDQQPINLTHKERERERKRLKKIARKDTSIVGSTKERSDVPTSVRDVTLNMVGTSLRPEAHPTSSRNELQAPRCYTDNPNLRVVLDGISDIFKSSSCEGYLFGSANYKSKPNDFDILLPNITSDEARLEALIKSFEDKGWEMTAGKRGYITADRHVIPMVKNKSKIELIVFNDNYTEHAKKLDFTVGAMYFDLRQMKMCHINSIDASGDYKNKILTTIDDPNLSFTLDPTRIFRGIRLIAAEKFHFSLSCIEAIQKAFADQANLFKTIGSGKLYYQLSQICTSGFERENLIILHELGLLSKIYQILSNQPEEDKSAPRFIKQFKSACEEHTQDWSVPEHSRSRLTSRSMPNLHGALTNYSHFQNNEIYLKSSNSTNQIKLQF